MIHKVQIWAFLNFTKYFFGLNNFNIFISLIRILKKKLIKNLLGSFVNLGNYILAQRNNEEIFATLARQLISFGASNNNYISIYNIIHPRYPLFKYNY